MARRTVSTVVERWQCFSAQDARDRRGADAGPVGHFLDGGMFQNHNSSLRVLWNQVHTFIMTENYRDVNIFSGKTEQLFYKSLQNQKYITP